MVFPDIGLLENATVEIQSAFAESPKKQTVVNRKPVEPYGWSEQAVRATVEVLFPEVLVPGIALVSE